MTLKATSDAELVQDTVKADSIKWLFCVVQARTTRYAASRLKAPGLTRQVTRSSSRQVSFVTFCHTRQEITRPFTSSLRLNKYRDGRRNNFQQNYIFVFVLSCGLLETCIMQPCTFFFWHPKNVSKSIIYKGK